MGATAQRRASAMDSFLYRAGDDALNKPRRRYAEAYEFLRHPIPFDHPDRRTFAGGSEYCCRAAAAGKAILSVIDQTPDVHSSFGKRRDKCRADAETEGQVSLQ